MKRILILFVIHVNLVMVLTASARFLPDTYQNPPGIKWKKIDTEHYEVVFPEEIVSEAQRVANILEHVFQPLTKTLRSKPQKITVFLANQGTWSNGYVNLAPRKSEWFNTPPQDATLLGTGEWYELLAIHEGRHVLQFDKLNQNLARVFYYMGGEIWQLLLIFEMTPLWFLEGDSVATETVLSDSGRGRLPAFDMMERTLLLSGRKYSYAKSYLGSFKDFIPSYYQLGYLLVNYMRRTYGGDICDRVMERMTKDHMVIIFPYITFSRALEAETGKNLVELYEDAMKDMENMWKNQLQDLVLTGFKVLNTRTTNTWTNYIFPCYDSDGTVIAQKFGLDTPMSLVRIYGNGKEKFIKQFYPLEIFGTRSSVKAGKVVWNEDVPDPRWAARSYSVITSLDTRTGKLKRITKKTKLYNPELSPDGTKIVAVEFTPHRKCSMVIIDSHSGKELHRLQNPENYFIQSPSWSPGGTKIVFTKQKFRGKAMTIHDLENNTYRDIIPEGKENIAHPVFYKNFILYESPCSGIDNIYAIDVDTGNRYQVTSSKYGAFFPSVSPDNLKLVYSNYTENGFNVVEIMLDSTGWTPIENVELRDLKYYEPLVEQEQGINVVDINDIPIKEYEVTDYRQLKNLFNFHSWGFFGETNNSSQANLEIISNDKLNTALFSAGLTIDPEHSVSRFNLDFYYTGFYPMLYLGFSHGRSGETYVNQQGVEIVDTWRETSGNFGLRLPFNLSRGVYTTFLSFSAGISFTEISDKQVMFLNENGNGRFAPVTYQLEVSSYKQSSYRDIYPRWGQSFRFTYRYTPWEPGSSLADYRGTLLSAQVGAFMPGFFKNHHIYLEGAYEQQDPENYRFSSIVEFSRGYDSVYHDQWYKGSFNYKFPISYPDRELGPVMYIRRLTGNLFYDYSESINDNATTPYSSAGVELGIEFNFYRWIFPFELVVRASYLLENDEIVVEPLFSVNYRF